MHDGYASVSVLEPAELSRLFELGDPQERLWAAWAMARRAAAATQPLLDAAAGGDAEAGVRRHLIVVVAGLGHRDLFPVLVAEDPSPEVRATACTYYLRTAPSLTDTTTLAHAVAWLSRGDWQVREAILLEQSSGTLRLSDDVLFSVLADPEVGLRRLAVDCIAGDSRLAVLATEPLARALVVEPDPDIAELLLRALPRPGYRVLFRGLRTAPDDRVISVLELIQRLQLRPDWQDLAFLTERTNPATVHAIVELLPEDLDDEAFGWAARTLPRHLDEWRLVWMVRRGLSSRRMSLLTAETIATLRAALQRAREDVVWMIGLEGSHEELEDDLRSVDQEIALLEESTDKPRAG